MITKASNEMDEVVSMFGLSAKGNSCWQCGVLLADPAVLWVFGNVGHRMYLCDECAKSVAMGIIRDAVEITHARGVR